MRLIETDLICSNPLHLSNQCFIPTGYFIDEARSLLLRMP